MRNRNPFFNIKNKHRQIICACIVSFTWINPNKDWRRGRERARALHAYILLLAYQLCFLSSVALNEMSSIIWMDQRPRVTNCIYKQCQTLSPSYYYYCPKYQQLLHNRLGHRAHPTLATTKINQNSPIKTFFYKCITSI